MSYTAMYQTTTVVLCRISKGVCVEVTVARNQAIITGVQQQACLTVLTEFVSKLLGGH